MLALAHARLAGQESLPDKVRARHKAEARRWFARADKEIDRKWPARPSKPVARDIWDFRAEARKLISAKESDRQDGFSRPP